MADGKQGRVFISCGQYSREEIKLGQDLAAAVDAETDFEGYFAQNQTSLEGLSRNILGALKSCVAFVAVLHHRGVVDGRHIRGQFGWSRRLQYASTRT
jgi:hypothetical protein